MKHGVSFVRRVLYLRRELVIWWGSVFDTPYPISIGLPKGYVPVAEQNHVGTVSSITEDLRIRKTKQKRPKMGAYHGFKFRVIWPQYVRESLRLGITMDRGSIVSQISNFASCIYELKYEGACPPGLGRLWRQVVQLLINLERNQLSTSWTDASISLMMSDSVLWDYYKCDYDVLFSRQEQINVSKIDSASWLFQPVNCPTL